MCKTRKLIVTNRICLGDREICYEAYSLPKGEVVELTAAQLKRLIMNGPDEVYGLRVSEKTRELEFDSDFMTTNLMNKVHTGILRPMEETETVANIFYIVIGTHKVKGETMYDVISSRYERTSFTADKVKMLLDMNIISAGAKLVLFVKFYASTFFTLFVPIIHKFFIIMQISCSQFFKLFSTSRNQLYTQFQDRYHFKSCTEIYSWVSNK